MDSAFLVAAITAVIFMLYSFVIYEGDLKQRDPTLRPVYTLFISGAGWASTVAMLTLAPVGTATAGETTLWMIFGGMLGLVCLAFIVLYIIEYGRQRAMEVI